MRSNRSRSVATTASKSLRCTPCPMSHSWNRCLVVLGKRLEHARTAIARLHELGADTGAGHLHFSEVIAQLMLNRSEEALVAARNAYPRLAREGDHYRLLLPLALLNALHGRPDAAARVAGFDAAVQARSGENASIIAPLLHSRLEPLLAASLSVDERARFIAEGAALRDEEAFKLAFDDMA